MIDLRERRRQLLNLTITEIILILLFLVLLIAANLIKKNNDLTELNKKLTQKNEAYDSLIVFSNFLNSISLAESTFKES